MQKGAEHPAGPILTRRRVLLAAGAGAVLAALPAMAEGPETARAIKLFTGGAPVMPGKVRIDVAPLVENGNSVAIGFAVDHPMREGDFVRRLAVFNEKNPQPDVAIFDFSPFSGKAEIETRIRLATSQFLTAIAQLSDGSFWGTQIEVIVTIAACTEE